MKTLVDFMVKLRMAWASRRLWQPFLAQTREPDRVQRELLISILRKHRNTRFGKEHYFAEISGPEDYALRVPIQHYEDLRPYLERQERDGTPELVAEQPIMYARTSGSTGKPKYVPILGDTLARHHRSQQIYSCCHHAEVPGLFNGSILAFVSPAIEGHLPSGTPYGSMSGLIYQGMPWMLRRKYMIPAEVFGFSDHNLKYLLIAAFAIADRSISFIAGANPSSFLRVARLIREQAPTLIAAVNRGELPGKDEMDPALYRKLNARFKGSRRRAAELQGLFDRTNAITFAMLWPNLKAVSCWREGSCRVLLPALQRELPESLPILEMGYLASELRGTLPVASLKHLEVPTLHENYFEFVERGDWESGNPRILTMENLEPGRCYHVIVTTRTGLYRYFMNDIIMVGETYGRTPTIRFVEKGVGVTSITGEKLYESQILQAIEILAGERNWSPGFFILVADVEKQGYCFYVETHENLNETFAAELDAALARLNLEYESKRASGRLQPIELKMVREGTGGLYMNHLVASGQREAQLKLMRLQSREKLSFDFEAHLSPTP